MLRRSGRIAFQFRGPLAILILGLAFLAFRTNLNRVDPTYIFSDTITEDLPMQEYFHARASKGELATWNPYASTGNPMIGTLQHRFLYPPRVLLYSILGLHWGHFFELIFHFLLTLFGTYGFIRSFGIDPPAAIVGVFSVLLSETFLASFHVMQNAVAVIAWLPVAMLALQRFFRKPGVSRSAQLGFAMAMLVYAGHPQSAFYAVHVCAFFGVTLLIARNKEIRHSPMAFLGNLFLASAICVAICAPQLLTSAELMAEGLRNKSALTPEQVLAYPMSAFDVMAAIYGTGSGSPWSPITAVFILFGCAIAWKRFRRFRIGLLSMVLISLPFLLLSIGGSTPFAGWIEKYYPLGSAFRFPSRASYVLVFPCALILSAFAMVMLRSRWNPLKPHLHLLFPIFLIALTLSIWNTKRIETQVFLNVAKYVQDFPRTLQEALPGQSEYRFAAICNRSFLPCDKSGMISRRRSLDDYEPANTYRAYLFSLLVSEELRNYKSSDVWLGETRLTYKSLTSLQTLDLLRLSSVKWILGNTGLWLRADNGTKEKILASGIQMRPQALQSPGVMGFLQKIFGPLAALAMQDHLDSYQVMEITDHVLPRAYISNRILLSNDAEDSHRKLQEQIPLLNTVIEAGPAQTSLRTIAQTDHLKPAQFVIDEPERIVLRTQTTGDSFLILNDKFFPGWTCTINGQGTTIYAANLAFRGVKLLPGENEIEFRYEPRSLYAGLIAAALACILVLAIVLNDLRTSPGTLWKAKSIQE
ncbi:MAG: YfhO family protein [Spirochaetia bacterium]|nr:YfhO family protein [Spirochaetia bacterium]